MNHIINVFLFDEKNIKNYTAACHHKPVRVYVRHVYEPVHLKSVSFSCFPFQRPHPHRCDSILMCKNIFVVAVANFSVWLVGFLCF
jgi:hypothetical protein